MVHTFFFQCLNLQYFYYAVDFGEKSLFKNNLLSVAKIFWIKTLFLQNNHKNMSHYNFDILHKASITMKVPIFYPLL